MSTFIKRASYFAVLAAVLLALADRLSELKAEFFDAPKPLPVLEVNTKLRDAGEPILENEILGPESLVFKGDDLYTGLMDGRIVKINVKTLEVQDFFKFNKSCAGFYGSYDDYPPQREPLCGRPLGMRIDSDGNFLVAESYSGLYRISPDGQRSELLVNNVEGRKITFINDLDVASDGTIYFSETSDRWGRNKVISEIIATRRVGTLVSIHKDDPYRTMKVHRGFLPCNGVSLSHDEQFVYFISSPAIYRLNRKTNEVTIAMNNMPGVMDNIRRRKGIPNRFIIGCASKRSQPFSLPDLLAPYPNLKNVLSFFLPQAILLNLIPRMGLLMEVDLTPGHERIVQTYQDRSAGGIAYVSEAEEHSDGYVYIGTWHERHLVRARADKLFS